MKKNLTATSPQVATHEGGAAYAHMTPEQALRRSVLSCLLWENEYYEDGVSISERIKSLCEKVAPEVVAALAIEARTQQHLRHVPLVLLLSLIKRKPGGSLVAETISSTLNRVDELTELVHLYWSDKTNKRMLPRQMKLGLEKAFHKFDAYQLAKWNRDSTVKLRDVLFMAHPKPKDEAQEALWKQLVDGTLPAPDTWEVALSAGKDKKETFERLIKEGKLPYMALLRNLRNMMQANCDLDLVREAIVKSKGGAERVLPFRYVAAARAAPNLEPAIDIALLYRIAQLPRLEGRTIVLVDVSGSMGARLSSKSDLTRMDAAAALASLINGEVRVFTFSTQIVEVPPRRGMGGIDAIRGSQPHGGTYLGKAVDHALAIPHDRLIVISDEQSADRVAEPMVPNSYMINVASAKNGVGYGSWVHIDGMSENIIRWIIEHERA